MTPAQEAASAAMVAKVRSLSTEALTGAATTLQADLSDEATTVTHYVLAELERRMDPLAFVAFCEGLERALETAND